eukprot:SAG22_NODE_523_length_9482_cov_4.992548_9_plen_73_part_00
MPLGTVPDSRGTSCMSTVVRLVRLPRLGGKVPDKLVKTSDNKQRHDENTVKLFRALVCTSQKTYTTASSLEL